MLPCRRGVFIMVWLLSWFAVLHELRTSFGFLHPIRLRHVKATIPRIRKIPLLSDNGDNYRVFFRPEANGMDGRRPSMETYPQSKEENSSIRKTRREREMPFPVKNRSWRAHDKTSRKKVPHGNQHERQKHNLQSVCRIVTLSDGKIPTSRCTPTENISDPSHLLRKLFHSVSFDKMQGLRYMDDDKTATEVSTPREESKLVSVVRESLEDAGFQLLTRRDLDLCDALNTGYLFRLSIVPDLSELDYGIMKELYPEFYQQNWRYGNARDLLFDGKVLVFWRGYSQEVSQGRLLLPKLDYLQASTVQRGAAWVKRRLYSIEQRLAMLLSGGLRLVTAASIRGARTVADYAPNTPISRALRTSLRAVKGEIEPRRSDPFFKLSRYGGSKIRFVGSPNSTDSLDPFLICEGKDECDIDVLHDDSMYNCINHQNFRCPYDSQMETSWRRLPPMQLLERVTMSDLVDPYKRDRRRGFLSTFFSKSELIEPTYKEVVVIWRNKGNSRLRRPVWTPPRLVYELADMFEIEGLPDPAYPRMSQEKTPLQIRMFDDVPMANIPAVMPKTKLVFRPADAFVFDLISIVSLVLVISSQRFDNARLDFLALVSVSLWFARFVIRYSNKLARYDLLVKTFLTSKISRRDSDALAYLSDEAGAQRAARASLVHSWLLQQERSTLSWSNVKIQGVMGVNDMVEGKQVQIDMPAALKDLEDLGLISCNDDEIRVVRDQLSIVERIRRSWNSLLEASSTHR